MTVEKQRRKRPFWATLFQQRYLVAMSVPFALWALVFQYLPLYGWTMAFQNFKPAKGFWEQKWVGFDQFTRLFAEPEFYLSLRNSLAMSLLGITIGFVVPIIFAILINEIRRTGIKRFVQTVSYLPHFISWVIAANLISTVLSVDSGVVNELLRSLKLIQEPINWLAQPEWFWGIFLAADLWKEVGWNSIIYIAAIAAIDQELYEAASIDGCGRWGRIRHVLLPSLKPTIVVILIMNIGWLMSVGFERQMLLGNAVVQEYSQTIDLYALRYGISLGRYSYGTAIGIFQSVISVCLVLLANRLSKRYSENRLL